MHDLIDRCPLPGPTKDSVSAGRSPQTEPWWKNFDFDAADERIRQEAEKIKKAPSGSIPKSPYNVMHDQPHGLNVNSFDPFDPYHAQDQSTDSDTEREKFNQEDLDVNSANLEAK